MPHLHIDRLLMTRSRYWEPAPQSGPSPSQFLQSGRSEPKSRIWAQSSPVQRLLSMAAGTRSHADWRIAASQPDNLHTSNWLRPGRVVERGCLCKVTPTSTQRAEVPIGAFASRQTVRYSLPLNATANTPRRCHRVPRRRRS